MEVGNSRQNLLAKPAEMGRPLVVMRNEEGVSRFQQRARPGFRDPYGG